MLNFAQSSLLLGPSQWCLPLRQLCCFFKLLPFMLSSHLVGILCTGSLVWGIIRFEAQCRFSTELVYKLDFKLVFLPSDSLYSFNTPRRIFSKCFWHKCLLSAAESICSILVWQKSSFLPRNDLLLLLRCSWFLSCFGVCVNREISFSKLMWLQRCFKECSVYQVHYLTEAFIAKIE